MTWTTADIAAYYKRLGTDSPVQDACGDGRSKYRARKTEVGGIMFDSAKEADVYSNLLIAQRIGLISELDRQPRFKLQDGFRDEEGKWHRGIWYKPDFRFIRNGKWVLIEVKGFETAAWRLKEKLFRAKYPDITLEVWK